MPLRCNAITTLRVAPLSLSPSCLTRKKTPRKKMAARNLGGREFPRGFLSRHDAYYDPKARHLNTIFGPGDGNLLPKIQNVKYVHVLLKYKTFLVFTLFSSILQYSYERVTFFPRWHFEFWNKILSDSTLRENEPMQNFLNWSVSPAA